MVLFLTIPTRLLDVNHLFPRQKVELHCDRCDITANLSMSRRGSYRGGGTYIAAINRLVMLDKGEILMHPGNLVHGGNAITAGTRYLLVAFADLEK